MDKTSEIICHCKNVTRAEIENAVQNGAKSLKDIQQMTSACTGNLCSELNPNGVCCSEDITSMLPMPPKQRSCCCG